MRILIAEDDARLLKSLIAIFLKKIRFYRWTAVSNGNDALDYALTNNYDGLVLDVMMPGLDGVEVLKLLRKQNIDTPAMFLTAKTEVYQRVEGLDAGADDYLSKPFSTSELLARVRAMLRRKNNYVPNIIKFNGLNLNCSTYELSCNALNVILSGKELQIMEMLIQRPNYIISTESIISHIWGWDTNCDISVVWTHISNLRKKINSIKAPVEIRFIRGAGYILEVQT